jgi:hypothetical protein
MRSLQWRRKRIQLGEKLTASDAQAEERTVSMAIEPASAPEGLKIEMQPVLVSSYSRAPGPTEEIDTAVESPEPRPT